MIINKTLFLVEVPITNTLGQRDSINIQPKGRAVLPSGWTVDPRYQEVLKQQLDISQEARAVAQAPIVVLPPTD